MSWTQGHLDALESAIASGTLRVTYDGKTVEYRSLAEMLQVRDMIRRDIAAASGAGRQTHFNPTYQRGT